MRERENILNELKTISATVAAIPNVNVFSVYEGYFEEIYPELQARISADQFYSKNAFTVPEGYFDSLEKNILQRIKAEGLSTAKEEISELSPVLARIGNQNIFRVPNGYFEGLKFNPEIQQPAKVIQMNPSRSRSIFRYAAAAVITGLLGISVMNIVNDKAKEKPVQIASLKSDAMQRANRILKSGTLDTEIASLSSDDIDAYLQQEGQDVNAAMVAASAEDASKLPEATDYLLDENTLDNYLRENNLKNL